MSPAWPMFSFDFSEEIRPLHRDRGKEMPRKRAADVLVNIPLRPGLLAIRSLDDKHRREESQMNSPMCRRVEAKEKFSSMQGQRSAVSPRVRRGTGVRASSGGCGRGGERSVTESV